MQVAQGEALAAGDLDRLDALGDERTALHARLRPLHEAGLGPADLAEARALVELVTADQERLIGLATSVRDTIGRELRGLAAGRTAVAGYRPVATSRAVHLDSTG
ncbi:MAG: flagellar protein FliT [Actinomycetota bacterium]